MTFKIKEFLLELEIFNPGGGLGYGVSAMLMHSRDLLNVPKSDLLMALREMERDGYVHCEEEIYWSTKQGQIEQQKLKIATGITTFAIANQKKHTLEDLLLAIVANDKVESSYSPGDISKSAIEVYLFEFLSDEISVAIESLRARGYIENYPFGRDDDICITGDGWQHYHQETRLKLALEENQGILSTIFLQAKADDRFLLLGIDNALALNLERRWLEMQICAETGAYLAAVILLGSILEGILFAYLSKDIGKTMTSVRAPRDHKLNSAKQLKDWILNDYILVAIDIGLLPSSVGKHAHELRDTRNFVHPNKQLGSNIIVDVTLFRISREVTNAVIDALAPPKQ